MCFHAWAVTNTLGHNSSFFPALRGSVRVRTNLEGRIGSGLRVSCQFAKKFPTGFCPTTAKRGLTTWAFVQPPGESLSSYRLGNRLSVFSKIFNLFFFELVCSPTSLLLIDQTLQSRCLHIKSESVTRRSRHSTFEVSTLTLFRVDRYTFYDISLGCLFKMPAYRSLVSQTEYK